MPISKSWSGTFGIGGSENSYRMQKKWHQQRQNVEVSEVVLVISPETPLGNWPLGRVLEVYPGPDGCVKVQVGLH